MSMNPEHEKFESLRRVLALKRHEQPPPGYFHHFSSQVIARIRAGERADDRSAWAFLAWDAQWLQRLWAAFETRPALAGAFGAVVCGLLVSGIVYSEKIGRVESAPIASVPSDLTMVSLGQKSDESGLMPLSATPIGPAPQVSSGTLFDGIRIPPPQLINFTVPQGN